MGVAWGSTFGMMGGAWISNCVKDGLMKRSGCYIWPEFEKVSMHIY